MGASRISDWPLPMVRRNEAVTKLDKILKYRGDILCKEKKFSWGSIGIPQWHYIVEKPTELYAAELGRNPVSKH